MKERFKTGDWEQVQRLPLLMFQFVSLADRQLQEEEVAAFVTELQDALAYKDPLHRELFFDLANPAIFRKAYDIVMGPMTDSVEGIEKEFKATRKILKKKLSTEEYHRFFVSLAGTGLKVAGATGPGPSNVSPDEVTAITVLMAKFEVDMDAGQAALQRL
ncbi:MAG: hypothetical protein KJ956_03695 [Actinobacteria bacterium]|nr:hypothetical protein [Actinomycetota bacterium]